MSLCLQHTKEQRLKCETKSLKTVVNANKTLIETHFNVDLQIACVQVIYAHFFFQGDRMAGNRRNFFIQLFLTDEQIIIVLRLTGNKPNLFFS